MSVIQQIQEKYAKLMAVIIAVALIIFVVMLAFENGGSLFNSRNSTTVGVVNGEEIEYNAFQQVVKQEENKQKAQYAQYGVALPEGASYQATNTAWGGEVNRLLLVTEFNKLGMKVGKNELSDILYGANPPADLKRQFTNQETGEYDAQAAKSAIDQFFRSNNAEQVAQMSEYIDQLEYYRMYEKYNALLTNSSNYPKWKIEKENAETSQMAKISFVRQVYSSIPDSTIKVTDKEIEEYINKHKEDYKQDENRSIAYVSFSALPSAADSVAAKQTLLSLKTAFDTTSADNMKEFLESQGVQTYYDGYINGARIQVPEKDSIINTPVGEIYGPYLDGGTYTLAKMIGKRVQPDTVKVRHILIGTSQRDPQSGRMIPTRTEETAKDLADSLATAIRNGSNFDTLCVQFSDDPGKNDQNTGQYNGGVYEAVYSGQMVPSFNDFIFGHPVGSKDVVKTDYGYHYIEILSQKGSSMSYKIAYLPVPITTSKQTDNAANNEATKFAGDSRNQQSFDANTDKLKDKGINKLYANNIRPDDYQVQGLGISRSFVKHIYEADQGEVLQPEKVGDNYIVAIVTEVNKKGTQSVNAARIRVEPLLINHKKAEQLIKKVESATTLEAAAAAFGGQAIESVDSVRLRPGEGQQQPQLIAAEPKVIGAAFYPANKGKVSTPIEGRFGVYVIRVDDVSATSVGSADISAQRQAKYQEAKRRPANIETALKEAATIKDYRNKFF